MAICTVTGTLCRLDETPLVHQQVTARIVSTEQDQGGQVVSALGVSSEPIEAFTDEDGDFEIDLVRGATVVLEIPAINLRKTILIPDEVEVDFITLI